MNPLQLADRYAAQIALKGQFDRSRIYHKTGITFKPLDSEHLAHEAIWLTAIENPKVPAPVILKKAKQLYTKWLREDCNYYMAEFRRKGIMSDRHEEYAENEAVQRCELESEVFYGIDQLIQKLGIHLGLWAALSYALKDSQSKDQTFWRYLGIAPTQQQEWTARKIVRTINRLV